jgi:pilus assembly protein CpaE
VVALGPGLPPDSALELVRAFDHAHPEVSVVVVAEPSQALLRSAIRAGARDVISPDAPDEELRAALHFAVGAANHRRSVLDIRSESGGPRKVVATVLCPKGGAGKTTVASNLAIGLARREPGRVAVVDLDLQFGDIASALHLFPEHTFRDAALSPRLDATTLKVFLTPHPRDLYVMCAPASPAEADDIDADGISRVLELLTESFDYVVIDTASGLDEGALTALEMSTDLVLVSAPDVPCVRSTQKEIAALHVIGTPEQRWHFVLNRADARTGLELRDIEATVGLSIDVAVPDSSAVPLALNQGTPILEADPRGPVSQALSCLVDRLVPAVAPSASEPARPSGGGLFRRNR